jgi:hypothetical protein
MTFERAYLTPELTLDLKIILSCPPFCKYPKYPSSHTLWLVIEYCNSIPKYQLPVSTYKFEPTPITLRTNGEVHIRGKPPKDTRKEDGSRSLVGTFTFVRLVAVGNPPFYHQMYVSPSTKKSDGKSCWCNRFVSLSIDMHKSSVRTSHRLTARDVGNNFGRRKYF